MKSHGMLFSAPMVRALLKGIKTQTRRIVTARNSLLDGSPVTKANRWIWDGLDWSQAYVDSGPSPAGNAGQYWHVPCPENDTVNRIYPRIRPGDELWVKETHARNEVLPLADRPAGDWIYRADLENGVSKYSAQWTPSILMPRVASRITLEVPTVRTEWLNDISEADAIAEGVDVFEDGAGFTVVPNGPWQRNPEDAYRTLWEHINGPGSWAANPPVWIYELKKEGL